MQGTAADSRNSIESDNIGWTQTKGPYGGMVGALHATPEGTLFAGAGEGGIFRSVDGGETWVAASKGLRRYQDGMFYIFPGVSTFTQKGNTLYAGTNGDLFYSTDGGDSWKQLTHYQRDWGISGVAIIGDTIYIGRPEQESVFFSNDNGKSWEQIDSGLTDRGGPRLFTSRTTLFAQMRRHVFRLKAGENSWTKLIIKDPWKTDVVESATTGFVVAGKVLYAATANGDLFRSTNMGRWTSIKHEMMDDLDGKLAVLGNTVFYISSYSANGRVFRSDDAGNSWTTFNTNLTNQSLLSITVLSEKILYVGTEHGVFQSTNGGESWTKTNTGIINAYVENLVFFRNALYTVMDDGIVKSADGGDSWMPVNNGLVADDWATLTVSGGKLYVATNETNVRWNPPTSGVYCLADNGSSWVPIQTNMQSSNDRIYAVNQLTVSGETFYVVGQMGDGARLYRWRVGEDLWTQLRPQDFLGWRPLAVSGSTAYISPMNRRLLRSVDEGDSWADVSQNLPNWKQLFAQNFQGGISDLIFVGETIYAKFYNNVFRSRDGGKTWTSIVTGLPNGYIDVWLADGTTLYGTNSHGIFRLTKGSDSWELIAPIQHNIMSLAYDGTTFYIGTNGEGIFRLSLDE